MGLLQVKHPLPSRSLLSESVYRTLLDNILSGTLASGAEVSEIAVAQELQVSRTPVREALRRLAEDTLLEQRPNRKFHVARFSRDDLREIYELRRLLESEAAGRAAGRLASADLRRLQAAADALESAPRDESWSARAIDFDVLFHDTLAEASGNRRLRDQIARLRILVRAFCRITATRENLEAAFREHRTVLRALERRDGPAAARAMADHVTSRMDAVLSLVSPEAP
jgi:DNA-binding GntR family transcriptional regulator